MADFLSLNFDIDTFDAFGCLKSSVLLY